MNSAVLHIDLDKTSPLENLHIDEALVFLRDDTLAVRAWRNGPAMVLGRFQDVLLEVDAAAHRLDPVPIVRRFSGGGAVYHDEGVLNLTLSVPTPLLLQIDATMTSLSSRIGFLSRTLASALPGIGPRVEVDDHGSAFIDQKKLLGCAAYLKPGRLLYHASILIDANLDRLHRLTRWTEADVPATAVASRRRPVVNLSTYWPGTPEVVAHRLETAVYRAFAVGEVYPVSSETVLSLWMTQNLTSLQFHSRGVEYV